MAPNAKGKAPSLRLGKLFGADIRVDASFFLIAALIGWPFWLSGDAEGIALGAILVVMLALLVLLHELGHVLAGRSFGIPTQVIELNLLGGLAKLRWLLQTWWKRLVIFLAGPAVNLVIALGLWIAKPLIAAASGGVTARAWTLLASVNLGLLIFNLLPAFPLDGGRSLQAILTPAAGQKRATLAVSVLGFIVAAGVSVLAIMNALWFTLVVALYLGGENKRWFDWARKLPANDDELRRADSPR